MSYVAGYAALFHAHCVKEKQLELEIENQVTNVLIVLKTQEYKETRGPLIARFMGPTWDPPGSCCPQVGPM